MAISAEAQEHFATHKFFDSRFKSAAVKVLPGEYYATKDDLMITTLLGSCIAVCLYDPKHKVGGMNHFLLPEGGDGGDLMSTSGRYGVYAMELLINHIVKLGGARKHLRAKVFGGGNVIKSMTHSKVGDQNVTFIMGFLKNEGIPIDAEDVLDIYPRKVNFFPFSGRVMMKKLTSHYDHELIDKEIKLRKVVTQHKTESGDVDLF